jgi:hypothetical protein
VNAENNIGREVKRDVYAEAKASNNDPENLHIFVATGDHSIAGFCPLRCDDLSTLESAQLLERQVMEVFDRLREYLRARHGKTITVFSISDLAQGFDVAVVSGRTHPRVLEVCASCRV